MRRTQARHDPRRAATQARERLKTAVRRCRKPLADLAARDANEVDTRLLVTDFLCDGLGFDKYTDLTTEYQVRGEYADYGLRIDRELIAFIEVKRVTTKLSVKHLRQEVSPSMPSGSSTPGRPWAAITEGGRCLVRPPIAGDHQPKPWAPPPPRHRRSQRVMLPGCCPVPTSPLAWRLVRLGCRGACAAA